MKWIQFLRDHRASVAPIFAIALVPMLIATGAAIDYSRAFRQRVVVQDALDAAALAAGKKLGINTDTQVKSDAQNFYSANVGNKVDVIPAMTPVTTTTTLTLTTQLHVPTYFLGLIGLKEFIYNLTSQSTVSSSRLRVALVLDNTGSMSSSGKMTALKTATTNLLTQLKNAANVNGDVYVSIIPFVKDVNVGSYTSAMDSYVSFDDSSCTQTSSSCDVWWDASNGSCSKSGSSTRSACLGTGTCDITSKTSSSSCTSNSGCFVNGSYNSSYTSSSTCTAVGTCSASSYTSSSACTGAGSCNISSQNSSSSCTSTNGCFSSGTYTSSYTSSSSCTAAGVCTITSKTSSSSCTSSSGCFISGNYTSSYTSSSSCSRNGGTWKAGTWTANTWKAGTWTSLNATWTQTGYWNSGTWTTATWTPSARTNWGGCVTDRGSSWTSGPGTSAGNDQLLTTPSTSDKSTMFPAEQYSACPRAMQGLTYDWTTLNTLVGNMASNGSTNQPIGLVWGWQSLVGGGPFPAAPAMDPNYKYQQIIILLSDGLNTQDRWYGDGVNTSTSVDKRMYYKNGSTISGTCANVKAAGITIYSVQVNTGGDSTSTLLQNCATDTTKFFELKTSDAIITTFAAIGTELSALRLAM